MSRFSALLSRKVDRLAPAADEAPGASRRDLLIGATVVGGSLLLGACKPADMLGLGTPKFDFGAFGPFLKIGPDSVVTVINKHQDMGQGNHVGLAAMVAEELDADWDKVKVDYAPADTKVYGNALMGGIQGTGGSTAIADSWVKYRTAGAAARAMFVQGAAAQWGVPAGEVMLKNGVLTHASGKSAQLGEMIPAAAKITPPTAPALKPSTAFTLIGTERVRKKDSLLKTTGQATYTQDLHLPGMLTAMVAHSPKFGGKLKSFDGAKAKAVKGVVDVVQIPTGVAVIATNTYAARKGREALTVTWNNDKAETRSSPQIMATYAKMVTDPATTWEPYEGRGVEGQKPGGVENAKAGQDAQTPKVAAPITPSVQAFEATFDFPYLAHAAMEPMNCCAEVHGNNAKLTFGCQIPTLDQLNTALSIKNLPGAIQIETLSAGGSFGRRGTVNSDYVVECVEIAKHTGGKPVKLVWTREDDMTGGKYRPCAHHAVHVELDPDGLPALWKHRTVIQSFMKGTPLMQGKIDDSQVEGIKGSPYLKATPRVDCSVTTTVSPVTTSFWRSVGATHTCMVMEHTIDQLAKRAGKDPLDYRLAILTKAKAERHIAVLKLAAEKAGWGTPMEAGWARGIAVHECFGSVVANVVEVQLNGAEPKVRRVVVAVDCGQVVSPDQVRAQMEGGVCYGLSSALYGAITIKDGAPVETNFDGYRVLRMSEAPMVETYIIPSTEKPSGSGEPGTPVVIPAVANAIFALTGKPTTSLPFVKA